MQLHPGDDQGPTAPDDVEQHADEFFTETRALVGDRFAEARFDPDRGLRVTIIDLTDQDTTAITDLARRLGIASWVRVERAKPADLEAWERLRHDLQRLWSAEPRLLLASPTPDPGYRRPPVEICLTAAAESTAADLHNTYGDFVSLRVGALPYPPAAHLPSPSRRSARTIDRDPVNPAEMGIVLEAPLALRSGQTTTHGLLLTNLSDHDISVHTNGQLTATIINDAGAVVGGPDTGGVRIAPLVTFTAAPSETVRIPLLVGTASYSPELGYAVPAGSWHLTVPMNLADGRHLLTPALPLTITR
ncbi:hypothetical protein [Jatrophihabitans sp.]|uniref:hypothetical protein n=1 Tax=Jatrophihabitans sp. TaxID=1932789 RepID=UPI002D17F4D5|nr:hypothetical protein [Jatrophihabitans sp.]